MPRMVSVKCARCGDPFLARVADRNRGWGRFCSKSCKAIKQEQRTGQYARFKNTTARNHSEESHEGFQMSQADLAAGGYGDADWNTPFGEGKY